MYGIQTFQPDVSPSQQLHMNSLSILNYITVQSFQKYELLYFFNTSLFSKLHSVCVLYSQWIEYNTKTY